MKNKQYDTKKKRAKNALQSGTGDIAYFLLAVLSAEDQLPSLNQLSSMDAQMPLVVTFPGMNRLGFSYL